MLINSSFLDSFYQFSLDNQLIREGEKIVVAVSGGVDSVVLLNSLINIKDLLKLSLVVVHFNHELRGKESNEDEEFVTNLAKQYGMECYIERANTKLIAENQKLSTQEAARNLRYAFFSKIRTSLGFSKIATGHNADDNVETVMLNLFRGTGVEGLSGIPIARSDNDVIRPLLFATRQDIETFALEKKLPYRVDSSNLKDDYLRNFLRHNLIPIIKENINPNIAATIFRTSMLFNDLDQFLSELTRKQLPEIIIQKKTDEIIIDLNKLHQKPIFLQEHFLFNITKEFTKQEVHFSTVRAIHKTTYSEPGTSCSLRIDSVFFKDRNIGVFRNLKNILPFTYNIMIGNDYKFEHFYFKSEYVESAQLNDNPNEEYIDGKLINNDLIIRNWNEGDYFYPIGMEGKKKLSDFFVDEKLPIFKKPTIPILESNGKIVWICGMRLDNRFKLTPKTKKIVKLVYQEKY